MTFHSIVAGTESASPPVVRDIIVLPQSGIVLSFTTLPNGRTVAYGRLAGRAR